MSALCWASFACSAPIARSCMMKPPTAPATARTSSRMPMALMASDDNPNILGHPIEVLGEDERQEQGADESDRDELSPHRRLAVGRRALAGVGHFVEHLVREGVVILR